MKYQLIMLVAMVSFVAGSVDVWAQGPGGPRLGRPSFDRLLQAFDENEDDNLAEDEVPMPVWRRLSQADADDDGCVTRKEFDSFRP